MGKIIRFVSLLAIIGVFFASGEVYEAHAKTTIIASGKCGNNITWELSEDGVLTLQGRGAMWDFGDTASSEYHLRPWEEHKNKIEKIIIIKDN